MRVANITGENMMNKYFEYTDNKSHKFWEINTSGKKVTVTYGRIGIQNPHSVVKEFVTKNQALMFADKKISEKQKKGYIEY